MATLLPLYLRFLIFLAETQKMRIYREKNKKNRLLCKKNRMIQPRHFKKRNMNLFWNSNHDCKGFNILPHLTCELSLKQSKLIGKKYTYAIVPFNPF